jgi:transcriptional regulator with XRE-family HTH domain
MKAITFYKPNAKLLSALASEIKKQRTAKGLTIEQFSELCDLHGKYLQTIERNGRNISVSVFVQIANALGIPAPKLLEKVLRNM